MTEIETGSQGQSWQFKYWFYSGYRRAFRPRKKPRKRRPTEKGQLIITGAALTAALGLNTETSFVYQLFALLLCLVIGSRIGLRISRPNLTVQRILPRYATAGQKFSYRVLLKNPHETVETDLTVTDLPKSKMPTLIQFKTEKEPDEDSRNAYDRFIGFHRFIYLQRQYTGITTIPGHIDEVPRQGSAEVEITATALRRGKVEFHQTIVLHQDPLALNFGYNYFDNPETLTILPKRYALSPNIQVSGGRNFQQGGISSAWSTGESDEFTSLRDYRDGDSMRKIHWPSSAKQIAKKQNLVVKEYQDEFFARNALVIDINGGSAEIVEETVSVAASLAMENQHEDNILDLIYQDNLGPKIVTADSGSRAANEQLEVLALIQKSSASFKRLSEIAERHMDKVTGCVCVFSSWEAHHETFVKKLNARGVELRCLVITEEPGPYTRIRPSHVQQDLMAI